MHRKVKIGDLLVSQQVISEDQLQAALSEQKDTNLKLGRILVDLGFVNEEKLLDTLANQLKVPFVELKFQDIDQDLVRRLPEAIARRFRAIIISESETHYLIGMTDPTDVIALDEINRILDKSIEISIVREAEVLRTIDMVYRRTDEIKQLAGKLDSELRDSTFEIGGGAESDTDAPVVRMLNEIFADAIQVKASDIHIEPDNGVLRIRQRVDGMLHEHVIEETRIAPAIVLRLKIMASLDISEKRLPQDGRFNLKVKDHSVDVRISTMPTQYGESVVMRLLDQTSGMLSLDDIGMDPEVLKQFRSLLKRPHGMILVTGPTGSGKTTTLYGALSELNQIEKKIITVEDPVEYELERVNQVQVIDKIGLTFSRVLSTTLRQDPDIIMVGEIRDQETAQIAVRAAMTGHLVLSTLHTNDAISSALRLIDMGAEGYLAATALRGVIAQRLVRKICAHCKEEYAITPEEEEWLLAVTKQPLTDKTFYRGAGCSYCAMTGYKGRIGVYELLTLSHEMIAALRQGDTEGFEKAALASPTYKPLFFSALDYARTGETSLNEVLRVTELLEGMETSLTPEDHSAAPEEVVSQPTQPSAPM